MHNTSNIYRILIITGLVLFTIFIIIIEIYKIKAINNMAAVIGTVMLYPTFIGIYLYSNKIKLEKYYISIILKIISITYIGGVLVSSLTIIFK